MVLYCFEHTSTDIDSEKDAASTAIITALFSWCKGRLAVVVVVVVVVQ